MPLQITVSSDTLGNNILCLKEDDQQRNYIYHPENCLLGAGKYATTYVAYPHPYQAITGNSNVLPSLVIKIAKRKAIDPEVEARRFARLYPIDKEVYPFSSLSVTVRFDANGEQHNQYYMFMTHIASVRDEAGKCIGLPMAMDPQGLFSSLDLQYRLSILYNLSDQLETLHTVHEGISNAIIHADIRPANTVIAQSLQGMFFLCLVDLGISYEVRSLDESCDLSSFIAEPEYFPKETIQDPEKFNLSQEGVSFVTPKVNDRTDVYMLLPVLLMLLGCTHANAERREKTSEVFRLRSISRTARETYNEKREACKEYADANGILPAENEEAIQAWERYNAAKEAYYTANRRYLIAAHDQAITPYNYRCLIDFPGTETIPIKNFVVTFFDRMQADSYLQRPRARDLKSFFSKLIEFYAIANTGGSRESQLGKELFCLAIGAHTEIRAQTSEAVFTNSNLNRKLMTDVRLEELSTYCKTQVLEEGPHFCFGYA